MKKSLNIPIIFLFIWGILSGITLAQVPQLINYQGVMIDPSTGLPVADDTYSIIFSIYNVASGGSAIWTETQSVTTSDGVYNVLLGSSTALTTTILSGPEKYLGIKVGSDLEMTPRKRIVSVAYAFITESVSGASNTFPSDGNVGIGTTDPTEKLEVAGTIYSTTGGIKFPDGTTQTTAVTGGTDAWNLTGNSGITPRTDFLGTTDYQALEMKVNNKRVFRLEPTLLPKSPNIIGGYANSVNSGVNGATIGGGDTTKANLVTENFGTIGGGYSNTVNGSYTTINGGRYNTAGGSGATIGGGNHNSTDNGNATVAGGADNTANNYCATVGGGGYNTASGDHNTVGGGYQNIASGVQAATIGGGFQNTASGIGTTIPGGFNNTAFGSYSFAAGRRAKANHFGTFVWGDGTDEDFASTANNQFLIRASGGVGIGTNNPTTELDVAGTVQMTGFNMPTGAASGLILTSDASGVGTWQPASAQSEIYFSVKRDASYDWLVTGTVQKIDFSSNSTVWANVGAGFNTTTSTFTAPVSGTYIFHGAINFQGLSSGDSIYPQIRAGGKSYFGSWRHATSSDEIVIVSITVHLDAGETAYLNGYVSAAAPPASVYGNTNGSYAFTYFTGARVF
jgi:hypothetical protein